MAVFTNVSEADITVWLASYSLGALLELQGIPEGIENTNYFVTTSKGRFVLTLFEKLTADELPFFLNLMAHLARNRIPCPCPVADQHNRYLGKLNGKPACLVSRLTGKSVTKPTVEQCAAIGAMLGRLHSAGLSFKEEMHNPRGTAWRLAASQAVKRFLSPQDAALLDSEVEIHAKCTLADIPRGVIHADLFRDNVLLEGDHVGGLVDFYFACTDALLYDVAITVNDWCMTPENKLDKERTHAMLKAYHAARPFSAKEAEAWALALRLAALRFWISRLYDLHLPREGELVNPRNPDPFKRILLNHIATGTNTLWI
jgi:homoserine kinase type II